MRVRQEFLTNGFAPRAVIAWLGLVVVIGVLLGPCAAWASSHGPERPLESGSSRAVYSALERMDSRLEGGDGRAGAVSAFETLCGSLASSAPGAGLSRFAPSGDNGAKAGADVSANGAEGRAPLWDRLARYVSGKARAQVGASVDQAVRTAPAALCRMAAGLLDPHGSAADLTTLPGVLGMQGGADMDLRSYALRMALSEEAGWLRGAGLPLSTLEVQTGVGESGEATGQILGVLPLWRDAASRTHVMTQMSYSRSSAEGDTVNAGMAVRRLSEDKRYLYGINLFLDHGTRMNHNRMSVGADLQTAMLGVAANYYIPLSNWRSVDAVWEERAAEGADLELQGRIPQLPSWQANLRGFYWSGDDTGRNEEGIYGYDAGLEWTPYRFFTLEGGVSKAQSADTEARALIRVQHRLGDGLERATERTTRLRSVEDRVYDKVRRENIIRTERRKKESALLTVTENVGANSAVTDDGAISLATGITLSIPATITVVNTAGAIARLRFADGALLNIGAGSSVRIEAEQITLISGIVQYVSGSVDRTLTTPGSTIALLGTDVDLRYDGSSTTLRVRDGLARLAAISSTTAVTLNANAVGSVIGGAATTLSAGDILAGTHTSDAFTKLDLAASMQSGGKLASYVPSAPRLAQSGSTVGEVIEVAVPFTTPITLSGPAPTITIRVNNIERTATLHSGAGTNELRFRYTIALADGVVTGLSFVRFNRNGASITGTGGGAGNNAITDIPATAFGQTAGLPTPTLELDFVNGTYRLNGISYASFTAIPGATFTRASPAVTYAERADGTLQAFSANTPRITDKGLLVEGSRTNLLLNSVLAGGGSAPTSWSQPTGTGTSAPAISTLNGDVSAFSQNAANERPYLSQNVNVSSSTTYTFSAYVEAVTGTVPLLQFMNIVSLPAGSTITPDTLGNLSPGQRRTITLSVAGTAGTPQFRVGLGSSSILSGTVRFSMPQLEIGAFASSYIPTTTAAVTRSADVAEINPLALSTPLSFSAIAQPAPVASGVGSVLLIRQSGTVHPSFQMYRPLANRYDLLVWDGVTPDANLILANGLVDPIGTLRFAGRIANNNVRGASSSALSPLDSSAPDRTYGRVTLGNDDADRYLFGYLQRVTLYPTALSDAQLQSLTAP